MIDDLRDEPINNDEEEEIKVPEEGEVLKKEYEFVPSALCVYRQRGPYLICTSCELQHAKWIGMDKIMTGEDESGKPIVRSRSEL